MYLSAAGNHQKPNVDCQSSSAESENFKNSPDNKHDRLKDILYNAKPGAPERIDVSIGSSDSKSVPAGSSVNLQDLSLVEIDGVPFYGLPKVIQNQVLLERGIRVLGEKSSIESITPNESPLVGYFTPFNHFSESVAVRLVDHLPVEKSARSRGTRIRFGENEVRFIDPHVEIVKSSVVKHALLPANFWNVSLRSILDQCHE